MSSCSNHKSALLHPHLVNAKISKEIALGRMSGPFTHLPFPVFIVSPLGLIPKKVPGENRLIHDLSFPCDLSVNSHIDPSFTKVSYEDLDHAISIILSLGKTLSSLRLTSKMPFASSLYTHKITGSLALGGTTCSISTSVYLWDVAYHVNCSRHSPQPFSGYSFLSSE